MDNILIDISNRVITIRINRPASLNALNRQTLEELQAVFQDIYRNPEIGGAILTGEGEKAFVAGADIREIGSLDRNQALPFARKGQELFKKIEDCPKPVIAAINGFALGGGCELAMACHVRIATVNARFGQPEVNLGIIPGYGGTQRLTQIVGRGKALELMLTGDMIGADEARNIGLVNHVVATRDELMKLAADMMQRMLSKAPVALANVIRSVNSGFGFEMEGYTAEAENFAACTLTKDFREGTGAFLEKRKPNFTGG